MTAEGNRRIATDDVRGHLEHDSHSTGLTFPGMMEDPGCVSGRWISPIPQRGPDASQRKSLAIFIKLTASDFKLPLMCTALLDWHRFT